MRCWDPCTQAPEVMVRSHDRMAVWEGDIPLMGAHSEA